MDAAIYMRDDYLRTAFDMFDKDGSGKIDKHELMGILSSDDIKGHVPKEQLFKYLDEIDQNGDGEIDFEEFQEMMEKCQL